MSGRMSGRMNTRPSNPNHFSQLKGSLPMYSMHEALARDRMREAEQRSAEARLTRMLSAHRRWHRVAVRARAAEERLAREVSEQLTTQHELVATAR
jgi:hypothetical protein